MEQIINCVLVGAIGVLILIMMDYAHYMGKMAWKRVHAIMSPVYVIWFVMLYLVITTP